MVKRLELDRANTKLEATLAAIEASGASAAAVERPSKKGVLEVPLDQTLEQTVHQLLVAVLESEGGNRARTAQRLGVSLRTVQRHLARSATSA